MGGKPRKRAVSEKSPGPGNRRRRMSGLLGELPLPPAYTPRVPRELRVRVERSLARFSGEGEHHPLLDQDEVSWTKENLRLLKEAEAGTPGSLAALVERDPRYLGTELGILWILDRRLRVLAPVLVTPPARWHLDPSLAVIAEAAGIPMPGEVDAEMKSLTAAERIQWHKKEDLRQEHLRDQADTARSELRGLADAVSKVPGSQLKTHTPDRILLEHHRRLLERVKLVVGWWRKNKNASESKKEQMANTIGVPTWVVTEIFTNPRQSKHVADKWLVRHLG